MDELYEIKREDFEKLIATFLDAFSKYPKLMGAFPREETRKAALEATLYFYLAYDLAYGKGYSTDSEVNDAMIVLDSSEMTYTEELHRAAGSYDAGYWAAMDKLSPQEQETRVELFKELDRMEAELDLPEPNLYVDFLGVKGSVQRQGRGRRLINALCEDANKRKLPIMLFTNTPEDVEFYKSFGFVETARTVSEKFMFENVYLIKEPA